VHQPREVLGDRGRILSNERRAVFGKESANVRGDVARPARHGLLGRPRAEEAANGDYLADVIRCVVHGEEHSS
jgi:hypothetical protein